MYTVESTFDTNVSEQNRVDDVKECLSCKEKEFKNLELSDALSRQTALVTAEMISTCEREFMIPKEKYHNLHDAMQKSRNFVFVVFDNGGMFEHAVPDIFRGKQTRA